VAETPVGLVGGAVPPEGCSPNSYRQTRPRALMTGCGAGRDLRSRRATGRSPTSAGDRCDPVPVGPLRDDLETVRSVADPVRRLLTGRPGSAAGLGSGPDRGVRQ
jgi:hypothetical protein